MTEATWRILFVDDEEKMVDSLRRILRPQEKRWDMSFETDPLAAVELFKHQAFDIVVSDLRMPGLTGLEMIARMQAVGPSIAEFILLTGNADLASAIEAINRTGVLRFLTKPWSPQDLVDSVEDAIVSLRARTQVPGEMATAALSAMSPAVAVVAHDGKVVYFNDSADEVLKSHDGIIVDRNGICVAACSRARNDFQRTIQHAAQNEDASPKFVTLSDQEALEPLTAVVMPVGHGRAAIMFTVPGRFEPPTLDSLVELFGLTRVEATLAQTIASGGTVEDAAANCKVTVETARTYLKRIFQKVGVRRQVDLVQLILTTPAALVRSRAKAV